MLNKRIGHKLLQHKLVLSVQDDIHSLKDTTVQTTVYKKKKKKKKKEEEEEKNNLEKKLESLTVQLFDMQILTFSKNKRRSVWNTSTHV